MPRLTIRNLLSTGFITLLAYIQKMQEENIEEMPPYLEDRTTKSDNSSVDSNDTSKSGGGIADECQLLGLPSTFVESDVRPEISEGAFSIVKNFPVLRVFSIACHACISLRESFCIVAAHYGGFVFPWDGSASEGMERNIDGLNGCEGVRRVCGELINTLRANGRDNDEIRRMQLGWITIWSDTILNSFIEQKDNSVWLLTATVCPPYDQTNSDKYKFVLAMGKSSLDHAEVINHYLSEIEGMKKGFTYYSADVNDYRECAMGLLENQKAEFYNRKNSKNYPQKRIPDQMVPKGCSPGARHIGPKRMSSKWLIAVCKYAYGARRRNLRTKENIEEYLRTCNIRDEIVQAIKKVAEDNRRSKRESDISDYIP